MTIILYSIMCFIFGTTFLAIKVGVDQGFPPFLSAGIRFFAAGAVLYLFLLGRKRTTWKLLLRKELMLTGFSLTFITFASLYWAEQFVSSGIAAILSASGPIMIVLLQNIFLRVKMDKSSIIGVIVGFIGVFFLFLPGFTINWSLHWIIGCGIILIGEIGYAAGSIYSSKIIGVFKEESPIALNAVQMIYGGIFLLVLSLLTRETVHSLTIPVFFSLVYLTIAGSMVAHTIYYYLVAKTNAFLPSTWLYVSPLIALGIGHFFYKEDVHPVMFIGVILILSSLVLINIRKIMQFVNIKKMASSK
ncbi:DMT family transporter [Bacillus sp. B1-b2]|uniref:DMT family transporter n=1 Tax=Bacillus sp. B1-b2 TaxID=2653201 RepID=UPI001262648A|nr:EamA family transporter [Bacillus sp. B1-b2]KAB7667179.1 EamA family transporter [Bacillus sp. B1-b2]